MKLTEKELESVKCTLIDETSDFILDRVCDAMVEKLADEGRLSLGVSGHDLDLEQIDEVVCAVFKGLYHERDEFDFNSDISLGIKDGGIYFTFNDKTDE